MPSPYPDIQGPPVHLLLYIKLADVGNVFRQNAVEATANVIREQAVEHKMIGKEGEGMEWSHAELCDLYQRCQYEVPEKVGEGIILQAMSAFAKRSVYPIVSTLRKLNVSRENLAAKKHLRAAAYQLETILDARTGAPRRGKGLARMFYW